jgi:transcriptional regulator with XRE-family HTH domain
MKRNLTLADLERAFPQNKVSIRQRKQGYVRYCVADFAQSLRTRAGLTQTHLARRADLSKAEISKLEEAGGSRAPNLWTLIAYAESCGYELTVTARSLRGRNKKSSLVGAPMTYPSRRRKMSRRP